MGVPIRRAVGSIRFSLGEGTSTDDIDFVLSTLPGEVDASRSESARPLTV
jgi:cysteine desulfurase